MKRKESTRIVKSRKSSRTAGETSRRSSTLKGEVKKQDIVENAVCDSIRSGELRPGERLAPLAEMADILQVSQSAVYRAMQTLVEDDMVECRGARGFYVTEAAPQLAAAAAQSAPQPSSTPSASIPMPAPAPAVPSVAAAVPQAAAAPVAAAERPGRVYLFCNHHSDLTWKYPYAKYAAIREEQLDLWADFFGRYPEFTAFAEQAEVLRVYGEKRPEKLEPFKKAYREGRLTLSGVNSIHDLNLCCGELLVRNLQRGRAWCRDNFGAEVDLACLNDAFGMASQVPQVLAQAGFKYLYPGRRPAFPRSVPGNVPFTWRGLDGTTVTVVPVGARVDSLAFNCNANYIRTPMERLEECLEEVRDCAFNGDLLAIYETETTPLLEDIFGAVVRANRTPGKRRVRFGSLEDYCRKLNPAALPEVRGEFNPVFTGCYTTRITVKQALRAAENALFAAELLAAGRRNGADFSASWHALEMGTFHDAACGCHTDPANRDVTAFLTAARRGAEETLSAAGGGITVLNPGGAGRAPVELPDDGGALPLTGAVQAENGRVYWTPELPALGTAVFPAGRRVAAPGRPCGARFATRCFDVDFSTPYPRIRDLRAGTEVFPAGDGFGEILFRFETGSMWSEVLGGDYLGRECQEESVESVTEGDVFFQAVTRGRVLPREAEDGSGASHWDGFESLAYTRTWRFYKELDYFTLDLALDWSGCNTKISIRFPLNLEVADSEALYDVPFAAQRRYPYYEVPQKHRDTLRELNPEDYRHAAGDWPALHWVDYRDHRQGLALANSGTPGHQLVGGNIYVSLLRSGTLVADGGMRPMPGALDNGRREYSFAFRPHAADDWRAAAGIGETLNRRPVVLGRTAGGEEAAETFFAVSAPNIAVSSIRPVADGTVVRLYENSGAETVADFSGTLAAGTLAVSDLREETWEEVPDRRVRFAPFAIRTLKFSRA